MATIAEGYTYISSSAPNFDSDGRRFARVSPFKDVRLPIKSQRTRTTYLLKTLEDDFFATLLNGARRPLAGPALHLAVNPPLPLATLRQLTSHVLRKEQGLLLGSVCDGNKSKSDTSSLKKFDNERLRWELTLPFDLDRSFRHPVTKSATVHQVWCREGINKDLKNASAYFFFDL